VASVVVEALCKSYGSVDAVRNISFTVEDGSLLVILGPSGCGKTSTLRMVAGLESITSGNLLIDGAVSNDVPPAKRNVAMAFENYGLYPHWSAYDNIAYPLRLRNVGLAEIDRRVRSVAESFRLANVLEKKPKELSAGYRQRIGLARALVRNPTVFLLDEPLSHVDADMRTELRAELKRIHRESGATMIVVSHDQLDAMTMADTVVVMNKGEIQQIGPPAELYNRPNNVFVAGFIGEPPMNLLECQIRVNPDQHKPEAKGEGNEMVVEWPFQFTQREESLGDRLTLGFRAHALRLGAGSDRALEIPNCQVDVVEPLGDVALISLSTSTSRLRAEIPIVQSYEVEVGALMSMSVDTSDLHLFHTHTGARISDVNDGSAPKSYV